MVAWRHSGLVLASAQSSSAPARVLCIIFVSSFRISITVLARPSRPAEADMQSEPIMDVAHLGHLELLTPKPEESLRFFVNVMGMTESGREGDSVYLRAYDDYERHSLKLTASKVAGMGHVAYRTRSPQALERRIAALKGIRIRNRLERRRSGAWSGVCLPGSGRAQDRALLRDAVVSGAARIAAVAEESGAAVSRARH